MNLSTHTHDKVSDDYVSLSEQITNLSSRVNDKFDTMNSTMNQRFNENTRWLISVMIGIVSIIITLK